MKMVKTKVWRVKKLFDGLPKDDDLEMVEEDLPPLQEGEFMVESLYLSVDPYMRKRGHLDCKVGDFMAGEQVGKVIETRNKDYPIGTIIRSFSGWRTRTIMTRDRVRPMPKLGDLPLSTTLGVVGMPGMTAYFGFLEICKPKEGDVVVVSGAAGATGSIVGQIAKIKGCKVIGFAGTKEKCDWLKEIGFDFAFN